MQNTLKPQTMPTLQKLNHAKIGSIMVTGDNPLTACYVAVACKLVSNKKKIYLSKISIYTYTSLIKPQIKLWLLY